MKKLIILTLAALLPLSAAYPHGGRTNGSGCHNQKATGSYHCHDGSSNPRKRSGKARYAFRKNNPCPATGRTKGACPGWHVDHVIPLACGGADSPSNMQWLTARANLSKGSMGCSYD